MGVIWHTNIYGKGSSALVSRNIFNHRTDNNIFINDLKNEQNSNRVFENDNFRNHIMKSKIDPHINIRFARMQENEKFQDIIFDKKSYNILYINLPFSLCFDFLNYKNIKYYFDELWVCSNFVKNSLQYVTDENVNINVLNHGIDKSIFYRTEQKNNNNEFTFLNVSIPYIYTKGLDILIEAYISEFNSDENVILVLKNRYKNHNDISKIIEQNHLKYKQYPKIKIDTSYSNVKEMNELYNNCDVYVHTPRLEAFGLPVIEAMACDKPVIITKGLGMDDYCQNNKNITFVDSKKNTTTKNLQVELNNNYIAYCFEPSLEDLKVKMRTAFNSNFKKNNNYILKTWNEVNNDINKLLKG